MASTNVRIDAETHSALRELSEQQHRPIGQIVMDAVEIYREEVFWREMDEGLARLRADPAAWEAYQNEIALWDALSGDGLEHEAPYRDDDERPHVDAR